MSEMPPESPPADPVSIEDANYAAVVSEIRGLRRGGASLMEACAETAFYRVALTMAATVQQD